MPELAVRLPCPVCLGSMMEKVKVGGRGLVVDHCRRCGGVWLERGEVQQLRAVPQDELWRQVGRDRSDTLTRCHDCHAPLERGAERCAGCGRSNVLDCPDCNQPMRVESFRSLRLDVCRRCEGVWFDRDELAAIWSVALDRSLAKRNLPRGKAVGDVAEEGGELLMSTLFFAPDLVFYGAYAAGHAAGAAVEAASRLPDAIGAAPELAGSAFEAVGEAAGSVFETILEIISGIFDGL